MELSERVLGIKIFLKESVDIFGQNLTHFQPLFHFYTP